MDATGYESDPEVIKKRFIKICALVTRSQGHRGPEPLKMLEVDVDHVLDILTDPESRHRGRLLSQRVAQLRHHLLVGHVSKVWCATRLIM